MFATTAYAQQSFYLSADKIIKNDKEKLILAQGNVEIQSGEIKLDLTHCNLIQKKSNNS